MALLFMDGFEQFKNLPSGTTEAELLSAGYTTSQTFPTEGRSAESVCLALGGLSTGGSVRRVFTSGANKVVIQFAYMADTARNDILSIANAFNLEWPDKLQINGNKGTITPIIGLWYYYELVIDKSAQTITVFINNIQDLAVSMPSEMAFLTTWDVTWSAPANSVKRIDDLLFIDSSGSGLLDRVGPQNIVARLPTSDVVKEWSPSTGDDHYELVNNLPPVEGEYIQSATSGATDLFLSTIVMPEADITAVGVVIRVRKSDIDDRQVGILMGQGETEKEILVATLATTPEYKYAIYQTGPGDAAWTDTSVLNTPFGVRVRP